MVGERATMLKRKSKTRGLENTASRLVSSLIRESLRNEHEMPSRYNLKKAVAMRDIRNYVTNNKMAALVGGL